ncbi:hypothetical protein HUJ04_001444 [Dendroctonus ponderosae]|nr:hypothetical protein HUJ04_001444 [Dendroctonus ponderosae]
MVQLEAKCTAIVKYSQTQYTKETQRICEINHAQYNNKGQDTLDIVSRKIVNYNRCSGSRHRGASTGYNRIRAFQGYSEHNN